MVFYNEMAEHFDQAIHDAVQHPVIIIISSCRAKIFPGTLHSLLFICLNICTRLIDGDILDGPKLTNMPATRFFINPYHEAVEDLRNGIRCVM